jgi:hypothetical protein
MSFSDRFKLAEGKMNDSLLAYTAGRSNSAYRRHLVETLVMATTEYLELRRQVFLRQQ